MIKIKTTLKESKAHKGGVGLFTQESVEKGRVVVTPPTPGLDIELEEKNFLKLPKEEQEVILHYGFKNKINQKYHLTFDDTRFINHSKGGNLTLDEQTQNLLATRNIASDEELTQDYSEFEELRKNLK